MKTISIAAAILIASSAAAFTSVASAQSYGDQQYGTSAGGPVGTVGGVVDNGVGTVVQGATGVVGGVTSVVGGVASVPGQVLSGRSTYDGQHPVGAYPCTVTGGGAVGTCNSTR